ncbi:MAG: TerB family tellurite resistance protein [Bdellovibrionales bacterium]|nr:TerB family tellurite resistance protein [Bdellovibrionales bacterium]
MQQKKILKSTIGAILTAQDQTFHKCPRVRSRAKRHNVELAVAILLVDLATIDQNFEMQEYNVIVDGLRRLFGTTPRDVSALINQAQLVIANLRGTAKFAELLKEELTHAEKTSVLSVINEVIDADGERDGFELYLLNKFTDILGLSPSE